MGRASILTLEPGAGGVPALARTIYQLLTTAGHEPQVIYRASDEVPTHSRWAALKFFLATPPVRRLIKEEMRGVAVADYAVPPRYQYHLLRLTGGALIAPIAAVVSGSSHVGLPLALARRPYVLWVATLYEDELRGRVAAGDEWAASLLCHRDWPTLLIQEQLVYERAGVILSLSPNTTVQITSRWPHLKSKLRTVTYPVDVDRFRPAASPTDSLYILLTARIRDPRKNVNMLLRAFAEVLAEFPQVQLVIAGDEPLPATRTLATELGLSNSVVFSGHVSANELIGLYQQAALFAFPSLQEGLGISVLEAMACGLPMVCTQCGGPEGIVQDGVTGIMTSNNDPVALAQAILVLLRDSRERKAMGVAARTYAVEHFARTKVEAQLRQGFKDVFSDLF